MNNNVLKRVPLPAVVLVTVLLPSHVQAGQKPLRPAVVEAAQPIPAAALPGKVKTSYTSEDGACTTVRKKLWIETGWVVRRVTSCR
jgi:hypothetical protein